jgi:hypothetical protein
MSYQFTNEDNRFFAEWRRTHPFFGRYSRGPTPFNVVTYFNIIANSPRPLTEMLAVWFEDYVKRYPTEWAETEQQVRIQGGPIHELSHKPLPWIKVYVHLWSGKEWIKVQSIVCGHLAKKHLQRLHIRQCQVQCRLDKFLAFTRPRRLEFICTPISNRSLCCVHPWECRPGVIDATVISVNITKGILASKCNIFVITVLQHINQQLPTTWYRATVSKIATKSLCECDPIRC